MVKKKKKGTRGAISVFLAIILVPCIVISSIFVDLSRVHLSKTTAESSADLALNTLLTNYDADLSDWYGMVASCQDIDKFYEISANYFLRTLASQGMSDEEIILLSDYYADATNDDTIYDLLKVECTSGTSGMIQPIEGANLSNAALMKDQVVEFMKYRAPIEITTGLVERLKSDPTATAAFEAKENEPLVEDKQEFFKAEGELTEAAYYSYLAIRAYYDEVSTDGLTNASLSEKYDKLEEYSKAYKKILKYTVTNLSNTSGLERYNRYTITLTYYNDYYSNPSKNFSEVYSERKKIDGVYHYYIDIEDVEDLVGELDGKIKAFNTAKKNFEDAAKPMLNKLPYGNEDNQSNPMQWWVQMNKAVNSSGGHTSKVKGAAQEMLRAYARVLAIDKCEIRGDLPVGWDSLDDWKTEYGVQDLIDNVGRLHGKYLVAGKTDNNDTYLRAVKNLESVSNAHYGKRSASNLYVTVDGKSRNLNDTLSYISTELAAEKAILQGYVDLLDTAIDGDGDKTPSLEDLKDYAEKYENTLTDWTDTAQNTYHGTKRTDMAEDDLTEIGERKASIEIEEEDVQDLKDRLVNIRSQMKDAINAIDSLKFGGESVIKIKSISKFKDKANVKTSEIKLKNSELEAYANTLFGQRFKPQTMPKMKNADNTDYNVVIDPVTKEVDTPELFVYLHKKYLNTPKQEMDKAKSEKKEAKDAGAKKETDAKTKGRYNGGGKDVPWEYSAGKVLDAGETIKGLVGTIEDLVTLDLTNMRDDLYTTTYIMEMFSYGTYENEGLYNLLDKEKQQGLTLTASSPDYYATAYETVKGENETDAKTWKSIDPKDYYNKSLTNKMINSANNAAYGAEVEYILYGHKGSTNEQNIKDAYSSIYTIRYGLNLVSGFQHFWDPVGTGNASKDLTAMAIYSVGAAVNGLTAGIVPIAATEAVLIPILTIFETSSDLDRLQAGFPVELYKTEPEQWWISLSGGVGSGSGDNMPGGIGDFMATLSGSGLSKSNTGEGLFYSDYLTLFVYIGLNSGAEAAMYQRMAEVIQFNIGTMAKKDTYSLKKSQMYFRLKAELRVKPLMITLPYFSYDEYENELTTKTDWCTYEVDTVRGYN